MSDLRRVKKIARQKKRHSAWRKVVTCVAALVVFCTTYALILPAITMEKSDYSCGLQAHTHTADCYQLSCGQVEIFSHTHGEDCYDDAGNLICPYPQQTLHHHSADCYRAAEPLCGLEVSEGHTHGETCRGEAGDLVCALEESQGHTHTDACYIAPEPLCGQEDIHEHRHTDSCYRRICELEAHTHDETCVSSHEGFSQNLGDIIQGNQNSAGSINAATEPVTEPTAGTEAPTDAPSSEDPTEEPDDTDFPMDEDGNPVLPEGTPAASTFAMTRAVDTTTSTEKELKDVANNIEITKVQDSSTSYSDGSYSVNMNLHFEFDIEKTTEWEYTDRLGWGDGEWTAKNTDGYIYKKGVNETLKAYATTSWGQVEVKKDNKTVPVNQGLNFVQSLGKVDLPSTIEAGKKYNMWENGSQTANVYWFEETADGELLLHIEMDEDYVKNSSEHIKCNIELTGLLDKSYGQDDGSIEYPVTDDAILTIPEEEITYPDGTTNNGDIAVEKSGNFSYADGKLSYEVRVTTTSGTPGEITINDVFTPNGLDVTAGTVTVTKGWNSETVQATSSTSDGENGTKNISMTLPKLNANEFYTIKYSYDLTNKENLSTDVTVASNKVTASSKPSENGKPAEASKEITVDVSKPKPDLSAWKSGSFNAETKELTYTITVTSQNGSRDKVKVSDTLTLGDGLTAELTGVTVNGAAQDSSKYTTSTSSNGDNTTYGFEMELDKLPANGKYEIKYTYKLPEDATLPDDADGNAKNTVVASSKDPDDESKEDKGESSSTLTVKNPDDPQPTLTKINDWNDSPRVTGDDYIKWTITANTTNVDIGGKTMTDTMFTDRITDIPLYKMVVRVDGDVVTDYSPYFTIEKDDDGKDYVKFVDSTEDNKNTHSYEFVYYTSSDPLGHWGQQKLENTVTIDKTNAYSYAESNEEGSLEKIATDLKKDENGKVYIQWRVTVELAADGLLKDYVFADSATNQYYFGESNHYFDPTSLKLSRDNNQSLTAGVDYTVKYYNTGVGKIDVTESGGNAGYMEITMLKNINAKYLYVDYRTYPKDGASGDFWNTAIYREKEVEAKETYVPDSFVKYGVVNNRWDNNTITVENFDGKLNWAIKATVGSTSDTKKLIITDTLPDHIEVLTLSGKSTVDGQSRDFTLTKNEMGAYEATNDHFKFTATLENGVLTLNVWSNSDVPDATIAPGSTVELYLACQVDEETMAAGSGTFENKASGSFDSGEFGSGSQKQEWKKLEENPIKDSLSKAGDWDNGNQRLEYTLVINPKGKDLQPNSAVVYVTDEFSYDPDPDVNGTKNTLEYELSSIKLYKATQNESGDFVQGEELKTGWRYTADENDPTKDFPNENITKYIHLEVPDETPLMLKYTYSLVNYNEAFKNTNFNINANNIAYLNTYPDDSKVDKGVHETWYLAGTSGTTETVRNITIVKVDEANSATKLSGAQFAFYPLVKDDDGNWKWSSTPIQFKEGTTGLVVDTDTGYTYLATDNYGRIILENKTYNWGYNTIYKMVEVKAPTGYYIPANAPTVIFYFSSEEHNTSDEHGYSYEEFEDVPDSFKQGAYDLNESNQTVTLTNPSSQAEFTVKKVWQYEDGTAGTPLTDEIKLDLYQIPSLVQGEGTVVDPLVNKKTVNVKISSGVYDQTYQVTRGSTVTVSVTIRNDGSYTPPVPCAQIYASDTNNKVTLAPTSQNDLTYTWTYTVRYNVVLDVFVSWNASYDVLNYSVTVNDVGASSGSTEEGNDVSFDKKLLKTITLNAANNWTWYSSSEDTPIRGKETVDGVQYDVWYSYYVVEQTGNWDTTYSNMEGEDTFVGVSSGYITVTNTLPPPPKYNEKDIDVQKSWSGLGVDAEGKQTRFSSVNFKLFRKEWTTEPTADDLKTIPEVTYDSTTLPTGIEWVYTGKLTADNSWKWTSKDSGLKLYHKYGDKYYTYFVIEEPNSDFEITNSGQVYNGGNITITNKITKEYGSLEVEKVWKNYAGDIVTDNLPANLQKLARIDFKLYCVKYKVTTEDGKQPVENSTVLVDTFSISNQQDGDIPKWTWKSGNLLTKQIEAGVTYEYGYYVEEISYVLDGTTVEIKCDDEGNIIGDNPLFQVSYSGTNSYGSSFGGIKLPENDTVAPGEKDNTITVTNTLKSGEYTLPQTGGMGTTLFYLLGAILTLSSAAFLTVRKRIAR